MLRRNHVSTAAAPVAAKLPASQRVSKEDKYLPLVVSRHIIDNFASMTKGIPRICLYVLGGDNGMEVDGTEPSEALYLYESLPDLMEKPLYSNSASNFEQLLTILEGIIVLLYHLPKNSD